MALKTSPAVRSGDGRRSSRSRAGYGREMDPSREEEVVRRLRASGRSGATLFAICCAERLRPVLQRVPSGGAPLIAGVALTELWRVLEGIQRGDPRRLRELSQACWTLVE